MSHVLTLLLLLFLVILAVVMLLFYWSKTKRDHVLKLFLGYENLWNSLPMIEARKNAPASLTREMLTFPGEQDRTSLQYARMVLDFFNHIGLQVFQGIIKFDDVYSLYGRDILLFWEKKNYQLIVSSEHLPVSVSWLDPWIGLEHLVKLCLYRRGGAPTDQADGNIPVVRNDYPAVPAYRNSFRFSLALLSLLALVSLAVFAFSFLLYHGIL
ncbi:MAG: hypothetical protein PHF84_01335 [bacterium]|nr:hypothetical protein [bacterium]